MVAGVTVVAAAAAAGGGGGVKLAKCLRTILMDSVFPEPDSPDTQMV